MAIKKSKIIQAEQGIEADYWIVGSFGFKEVLRSSPKKFKAFVQVHGFVSKKHRQDGLAPVATFDIEEEVLSPAHAGDARDEGYKLLKKHLEKVGLDGGIDD